ncbi:MAG: hypothetical protein BGO63_08290 [Candidatus Accumulibacter sp. 66-26]|nr:MAG: hypothetical protein BGO63_08290 [Candidatus Accumulibacter sp. 66-26]
MIPAMRALIFLLVLGNLLFLAWAQGYLGGSGSPDAVRLEQQLQPERLRIVGRGEPPAPESGQEAPAVAPEKAAEKMVEKTAEKAAEKAADFGESSVCLQWAGLVPADAERVERLLAEKFAAFKTATLRTPVSGHASYWVYIPPLANKQEAEKKAGELKRLSVPEYFIVQDAGPQRLAISLGIFSTEAAARERLDALRAKGVRSARVGERNGEPARAALEASGPGAQVDAVRAAVAALLPEAKEAACAGRKS